MLLNNLKMQDHAKTILLVDDEETVRFFLDHVLQRNHYDVIQAKDGVEALEIFEKRSNSIDLVITDIVMPRMNGKDLVDHLLKIAPKLNVIFISGYANDALQAEVLNTKRFFIPKPFTPDVLLDKVRELVNC